jgi:HEAT repeat protein
LASETIKKEEPTPEKKPAAHQEKSVSDWVKQLKDTDSPVRKDAAKALAALGPQADSAVPALIESLSDPDKGVVQEVAIALSRVGALAIPALTEALKSKNENVFGGAVIALGRIGPPAIPSLTEMLRDKNTSTSTAAALALSNIRPAGVLALSTLLKDQDMVVRITAATTLAQLTPPPKEAVPGLVDALNSEGNVPRLAIQALVRIGPPALPELAKALRNPDPNVSTPAASALLGIGEPAIPVLIPALEDRTTCSLAAAVLLKINAKRAVFPLIKALRNPDKEVRLMACVALSSIGPAAKAAIPSLLEAAKDHDKDIREYATMALDKIAPGTKDSAQTQVAKASAPGQKTGPVPTAQADPHGYKSEEDERDKALIIKLENALHKGYQYETLASELTAEGTYYYEWLKENSHLAHTKKFADYARNLKEVNRRMENNNLAIRELDRDIEITVSKIKSKDKLSDLIYRLRTGQVRGVPAGSRIAQEF